MLSPNAYFRRVSAPAAVAGAAALALIVPNAINRQDQVAGSELLYVLAVAALVACGIYIGSASRLHFGVTDSALSAGVFASLPALILVAIRTLMGGRPDFVAFLTSYLGYALFLGPPIFVSVFGGRLLAQVAQEPPPAPEVPAPSAFDRGTSTPGSSDFYRRVVAPALVAGTFALVTVTLQLNQTRPGRQDHERILVIVAGVVLAASGGLIGVFAERARLGTLRSAAFAGLLASLPSWLMIGARIVADAQKNPTSHNLWPFELAIIYILVGVPITLGTVVGGMLCGFIGHLRTGLGTPPKTASAEEP